ncbi:MAG: aminotransferase class I/II-fold pyridoxal phosphate-dependent enzyme [bacterium]
MELSSLIVKSNDLLRTALESLNKSGLSTLFVTDEDEKLVGILTDGSIRRSLLSDYNLNSIVSDVMNTKFISLPINTDNSIILNSINDSVKVIPLVDEQNRLVDYASINKIRRISIASPLLTGNELAYVTDCIKTNWISSQGKYVRKFEEQFSKYHKNYPALAVCNGTVALHLALEALNIKANDEVIVPNLTFAASVNAILYTGAKPVLVDVDMNSWNISIDGIERAITSKTKAIMPVHLYGNPCEMDAILAIAKKHKLFVIEDCAEALGSFYKNQPVGVFGDVSTFSFYGNKTITTGEGGMVIFKDKNVADRAATLRDHGMVKTKRYWHEEIGYNYRLTNIQAAIGVAQFERLNEFVLAKRRIAFEYNEVLSKSKFFQIPSENENTLNSYWLYTCLIYSFAPFNRDDLIYYLNKMGIETRPVFYPIHVMPPYKDYGQDDILLNSTLISNCGISLPSSVNLSEIEITYICNTITSFLDNFVS